MVLFLVPFVLFPISPVSSLALLASSSNFLTAASQSGDLESRLWTDSHGFDGISQFATLLVGQSQILVGVGVILL